MQRTLFRPVGVRELELILDSEARTFPPRLPEQPIFYPVLTREYAEQIARDWNTRDPRSGFAGFVTEFEVNAEYIDRFESKVVGASQHQEIWVPAAELPEFNSHLRSRIRTAEAFYGPEYKGPQPLPLIVRVAEPRAQLKILSQTLAYSGFDFLCELSANWKLILANYGFWAACPADQQGLSAEEAGRTLAAVVQGWRKKDLPLPTGQLVSQSPPTSGNPV
jgi:hypothetical protein